MNVADWLRTLGLEQYEAAFRENDVSAMVLPSLTAEDLKDLGVTSVGHRRQILEAIAALHTDALALTDTIQSSRSLAGSPANSDRSVGSTPERRQLTVMFCDLVSSTALSEKHDPEDLSEILRVYQARVQETIARFGGFIARYVGDGVLVYFGWPAAQETDAERAVRAALAVGSTVGNTLVKGEKLKVRIGIATGIVVVGEPVGAGGARQQIAVGETPNLAARLQAEAPPNGIIISSSTYRLTEGLFNCTSLAALHLHGFSDPVAAWQVQGESVAESRFDALHGRAITPMTGRSRELAVLMHCWDHAISGEMQVVLISGEAGIGKSRILHELRSLTEPSEAYILTLYCSPHHQASALYPVINYYERLARIGHDDSSAKRLAKLEELLLANGADLERTAPILATLLSIPPGDRYQPLSLTPEQLKEQTLQLLIRRIGDISSQNPVLCLIEDAHWIDPTSSELISRMILALKASRVLLVVTSRTPHDNFELPRQMPLVHLPLVRLDPRQAEELLHNVSSLSMPDQVGAEIIARADGVPLFIEELSKAVMESGGASRDGDGIRQHEIVVPATLQDSLMARLDRMSLAKPVAQLAAVLGRGFTFQLLSAVAPKSWRPIDMAIEALTSAEIILPVPGAQSFYQFKHALLQDVAYNSLLKTARRDYHGQIAHVIVEQFPQMAETQPEIVARHFTEAGLPNDAIRYWLKAGERATRLSSNLDSISHFERGLALLESIEDSAQRARIEYRFCLALLTPLIAAKGYTAPELERIFERALRLSEEIGDTENIFPALYSRQVFELTRGQFDRAAEHAREALQLAARNPSSDSAPFAGRLFATLRLFRGEAGIACEQLRRMLSQYDPARHRESGHRFGQDHFVACACYLALGLWHLGFPVQARQYSDRAIEYARSLGHAHTLQFALAYGGAYFAAHCRDADYLDATTSELVELGKAHSSRSWSAALTGLLGMLQIERGQTRDGIVGLRTGLEALREFNSMLWQPALCSWLARAYATCGEVSQGFAAVEMGRQVAAGGERWMDAELHRAEGELWQVEGSAHHSRAEECFRQALAVARAQSSRILELRAAFSLARLWQRQGRRDQALAKLGPVVDWFTEGRDNADRREAATLMKALRSREPL